MRLEPYKHWQEFGYYLRHLRQAKQYGLRELAREVPTAPGYICNVERGVHPPPSVQLISRLAELLDVPPQHLLARAGKLAPETWTQLLKHPAIPAVLSTMPGMTLEDAQRFCEVATAPPEPAHADSAA